MKGLSLLVFTASTIALTSSMPNMGKEFFQGFEAGMMGRRDDDVFEEYGCKKAEPANENFDGLSNAF